MTLSKRYLLSILTQFLIQRHADLSQWYLVSSRSFFKYLNKLVFSEIFHEVLALRKRHRRNLKKNLNFGIKGTKCKKLGIWTFFWKWVSKSNFFHDGRGQWGHII